MSPELTTADLEALAAVKCGGAHPDGSPRYLLASELPDAGARLIGLGLVMRWDGYNSSCLALTLAGHVEAERRGL